MAETTSSDAPESGTDQSNTDGAEAETQAAYLAAIVTSSQDAIVSKTLDGIITSWNEGATRIFGYRADEMIGQSITRLIPMELLDEEDHILTRIRSGERVEHFDTVRVTKDGRRIDVSLSVSPVRDKSGKLIGAAKMARDISERKQTEKLQQLLIGELNHRVKNTLATVQAIAGQTIRQARSPSDFVASFNGRLQALARTHTMLTDNTWRGADLLYLMKDQILLGEDDDERIVYSGPSVVLQPQVALHLAMVLHELATNARKYGALSVPDGRLTVDWVVRTGSDRKLDLSWRETGGPAVTAPTTRGFGMTVIEQSLAAHGGEARLLYESDGLSCFVSLPLPEVQEPNWIERAHRIAVRQTGFEATGTAATRFIIIEDEPVVAMDIETILTDLGHEVVGTASTVKKAKELIAGGGFDAALLDANLAGAPVDRLAAALTRKGTPFAFVTGYGRESLPAAFRNGVMLGKPFTLEGLKSTVALLAQDARPTVTRLRGRS